MLLRTSPGNGHDLACTSGLAVASAIGRPGFDAPALNAEQPGPPPIPPKLGPMMAPMPQWTLVFNLLALTVLGGFAAAKWYSQPPKPKPPKQTEAPKIKDRLQVAPNVGRHVTGCTQILNDHAEFYREYCWFVERSSGGFSLPWTF
eukprot:Skav217220  [mRNA]  locus=scaffold143:338750:344074:- [translate_table: standard]